MNLESMELTEKMRKISLVEDDQIMRGLLKTLLELEDYSVNICEESDEGAIISYLLDQEAGLIILDVHLSGASGINIVQAVKMKADSSIKVLMTSGLPLKDECVEAGADQFLLKPFMPDELLRIIQSLMG